MTGFFASALSKVKTPNKITFIKANETKSHLCWTVSDPAHGR